ncbi:hypothetical protein BDR04DRAFT_1124702 [Suillus decipiens]|nr:hypothetical protein BDR04DRAFT_1124702 [Suillus decipiens]
MSQYRDPYSEQQGGHNQQYGDASYNQYDARQPHQTYDQDGYDPYAVGEYRDDPNVNPQVVATSHAPAAQEVNPQSNFAKETGYQSQDFKTWRSKNTGGLWTRGSRISCVGRFCCCTMMITVFLIVSILLALLMWVRPPDAIVGSVGTSTTQSAVQLDSGNITVNLGIDITSSFVDLILSLTIYQAYYPINNTLVGNGTENDITFNSNSQTNITFPFSLEFSTSTNSGVLTDLASKCGVGGGAAEDITLNLDIKVGLRVLFFVVYPALSIPASFVCPISASDISV